MTWVKTDYEWGLPVINLKVSGRVMLKREVFGKRPSTLFEEPEKWASIIESVFCIGRYQGAKVVRMFLLNNEDSIEFTLTHPKFKMIPYGEEIPRVDWDE